MGVVRTFTFPKILRPRRFGRPYRVPSFDSGGAGLDLGSAADEGEDRNRLLGNGAPQAGRSITPNGQPEVVNIAIVPPSTSSIRGGAAAPRRGDNLGEFDIPMTSVSYRPSFFFFLRLAI